MDKATGHDVEGAGGYPTQGLDELAACSVVEGDGLHPFKGLAELAARSIGKGAVGYTSQGLVELADGPTVKRNKEEEKRKYKY